MRSQQWPLQPAMLRLAPWIGREVLTISRVAVFKCALKKEAGTKDYVWMRYGGMGV